MASAHSSAARSASPRAQVMNAVTAMAPARALVEVSVLLANARSAHSSPSLR